MSEIREIFRALREEDRLEREENRDEATASFREASTLAARHGFRLIRRSDVQYQLSPRDASWLINVYPGNYRLYHDRNKKKPPYLQLDICWTLVDVVEAAIREEVSA